MHVRRLAIVGLGLLGGSVGLAARRAGIADRTVAAGRRQAPLRVALEAGIVDEISDVAGAARDADLLVLATPVGLMRRVLEEAAPHLAPGALVTDVGSVKAPLTDTLPGVLPDGIEFVGAHPMAGSHNRGAAHATPDLFDGACCVVTPPAGVSPEAVERISEFWRLLGADVVLRDPVAHDEEVAWVSHVPHVLAFAFAHALQSAPPGAAELAGTGFRDFTRIARSDPELWSEIVDFNRKGLGGPLQAFGRSLAEIGRAIEAGDLEAEESFLSSAHETLSAVTARSPRRKIERRRGDARSGGEDPEILADEESADTRSVKDNS
jgi:prephenate dehydrogenase